MSHRPAPQCLRAKCCPSSPLSLPAEALRAGTDEHAEQCINGTPAEAPPLVVSTPPATSARPEAPSSAPEMPRCASTSQDIATRATDIARRAVDIATRATRARPLAEPEAALACKDVDDSVSEMWGFW